MNNRELIDNSTVVETPEDSTVPLVFGVRNEGSATAHNVQAHLYMPSTVGRLHLARHWKDHGPAIQKVNRGFETIKDLCHFAFVSPLPIHPDNLLGFGDM